MLGPSLGACVGVRMRLEKESVRAGGNGRVRERRNELARATAAPAFAAPGLLHAVRAVENHGRIARRTHAHEGAHVHDEIAVAEEGAALGDGELGRRPGAHLVHGAAHALRMHPLPFLHVHRLARCARGGEQIRLPAEERGDLEHVGHLRAQPRTARADAHR